MNKTELENAIKNGEDVWVAHRNAVLELCPDMSVKISNSDMPDVAMTTFEVDNGGIVIKRKTQWPDLFFHYDDISKNKAVAEHYAFHKNVTRTETLPFLTWEEFKEIGQISFIGKDKKEYILKKDITWSNNKYTLVDCLKIVNETDFTFSKYFDYTEENFYKAYDECVRLFKGGRMKVIYLGAYEAYHPNFDVVYQDINGKRDLGGDMLEVDLKPYDIIIATPPCNFWSVARGNRCSQYSFDTKHLLPEIIKRLAKTNKPFVVENVINKKRFKEEGIFDIALETNCFIYYIGRHTYFTNISLTDEEVKLLESQNRQDFKYGGKVIKYSDMTNKKHQGGFNVHLVIDYFLNKVLKEQL